MELVRVDRKKLYTSFYAHSCKQKKKKLCEQRRREKQREKENDKTFVSKFYFGHQLLTFFLRKLLDVYRHFAWRRTGFTRHNHTTKNFQSHVSESNKQWIQWKIVEVKLKWNPFEIYILSLSICYDQWSCKHFFLFLKASNANLSERVLWPFEQQHGKRRRKKCYA